MRSVFVVEPNFRVTRYKSVDKAAKKLKISTSAINKHSNSLEGYGGYRFYFRKPRTYKPEYLEGVEVCIEGMSPDKKEYLVAAIELLGVFTEEDLDMVLELYDGPLERAQTIKRHILQTYGFLTDDARQYLRCKLGRSGVPPKEIDNSRKTSSGVTFYGTDSGSIWRE